MNHCFQKAGFDKRRSRFLVHIPKFRNGAEKILANASTPDFFGASDIILGYALSQILLRLPNST
jgi:hypothetical protein